jgi:hypothetical protein
MMKEDIVLLNDGAETELETGCSSWPKILVYDPDWYFEC